MARIRTIKPEFWTDDKIISLPYSVRLFFIGLWNFSDDYGALQDKPDQLKLLILPSDDSFDVYQMIDLLIAVDLVERYVDFERDNTFLLVKNWELHQKVDKPTKSRILKEGAKKVCIPAAVRRKVAEKYGCTPGKTKQCECYFCGSKGSIYWPTKKNNEPSSWVCFSLELSHLVPESKEGSTDEFNLVLACRNCNRSMGVRNAFDWLFNGAYHTNQVSEPILNFRERSREFESVRDGKEWKGKDINGKESNGDSAEAEDASKNNFSSKNQKNEKKISPGAEIEYPFGDQFLILWGQWKEYKQKEYGFKYKSPQSEQASLNELIGLAKGIEENAYKIINQSMAKGWKGFFELKENQNGTTNHKQPTGSEISTSSILNRINRMSDKVGNGQ